MNKLLTVLPFSTDNAILAERLCDWVYTLSHKQQQGSVLLVIDGDVHPELRAKVKLAADIAFSSVDEVSTNGKDKEGVSPWIRTNRLFFVGSQAVQEGFKWPFLWLEPECVPTNPKWMLQIETSYESQPKRYMGSLMKKGENHFMARTGVYPMVAYSQLSKLITDQMPCEEACGAFVHPKLSRSKVFQQLAYSGEEDFAKVRPDAALVFSDSTGSLIEMIRPTLKFPKSVKVTNKE